ncbi:MAG: hypothetical protein U0X91_07215 [Spirosomataceae bacterium]
MKQSLASQYYYRFQGVPMEEKKKVIAEFRASYEAAKLSGNEKDLLFMDLVGEYFDKFEEYFSKPRKRYLKIAGLPQCCENEDEELFEYICGGGGIRICMD